MTAGMGKGIGGLYHVSALVSTTCQCEEVNYQFLMATTLCRTVHMHFVLLRSECDLKFIYSVF